jgi:3-(3-hydroxy-phenyl)propionate hydroxylase
MCHGFRDVANLAWKFKAVLRDGVTPLLLETYQTEREPHVRAVVEAAIAAGRYICERDPATAAKRDAGLRAAMGKPGPASASDLIPPIHAGVIDCDGGPGAGVRFIQPFIEYGGRRMLLDDATGGGFVLLRASAGAPDGLGEPQRVALDRIGVRTFIVSDDARSLSGICDSTGDLTTWFAAHDATAALLRPDFYVYGTAADSVELNRLVSGFARAFCRAEVTPPTPSTSGTTFRH